MSSVVKVDKSQKMPVHYTLRFKFAVALTLLVAFLLIVNAALVTYSRIDELEGDINLHAISFSQLTAPTIGETYQRYPATEVYKFREEVVSFIRKAPDVEQIMLIDEKGVILFDSANQALDSSFKSPQGTGEIAPPETVTALRRLEPSNQTVKDKNNQKALEIINPFIDNNGKIPFVVRYLISYNSLRNEIRQSVIAMSVITLMGILISLAVAFLFARRITQPVNELTLGATAIARGNFDHKLNISTSDELEDLARNFNYMAEQLKINISKLEESKSKLQESNLRLEQSNARLANTNKQLEASKIQLQQTNLQLERSNTQLADTNLQLNQANVQLEQANEELKELDRLKSEFLQTISHELRTPLSAIKGYNEYLLEQMIGPISAGQERALRIIQRNIDRLTTYINALLDFSRMESGTIPIAVQPFNLQTIIEQTILTYKTQLEKNELELALNIENSLPYVNADRDRIGQVLDNLISNAIKFSSEGGKITVTARAINDKDRKMIEISVADTGVGISEKNLEKIFDRFYQADSSTTRKYGGIGLGLSLVKSILESHKTSIKVVSREQVGTTFTFTLESAQNDKIEPLMPDASLALVENKKSYLIELIDDEPDINEMLKLSLIKEGYNVIDASTGEEGLLIAREHHPDLIILDVRLPDINGFEVLARLKSEARTRAIPVMIMSILNDTAESLQQGAVDHLTKPVDFKQLKTKINHYLKQANSLLNDRPTIMIVDDEIDVRQMICDRLAMEGFNTLVAPDGNSVFNLLRKERVRPSLILLDVMMPGQSGWDVITALKADPATAHIPVILVSAKGAEEDIKRGYALGAYDYIVKPFEIKDLMTEVKNVVREQANPV